MKIKLAQQLDAVRLMKEHKKKIETKMNMKLYENRISVYEKNLKTKIVIDFDHSIACCIKFLAVQKSSKVKITTRFLNGKV